MQIQLHNYTNFIIDQGDRQDELTTMDYTYNAAGHDKIWQCKFTLPEHPPPPPPNNCY